MASIPTMSRLLRHVFSLITILGVLLFIATVSLWIRSHRFTEMISWRNAHGSRSIRSASGSLVIDWLSADWSPNRAFFQPLRYDREQVHLPFNYLKLLGG